jgi:hypothetical protein
MSLLVVLLPRHTDVGFLRSLGFPKNMDSIAMKAMYVLTLFCFVQLSLIWWPTIASLGYTVVLDLVADYIASLGYTVALISAAL